jgi:hypothetical protein
MSASELRGEQAVVVREAQSLADGLDLPDLRLQNRDGRGDLLQDRWVLRLDADGDGFVNRELVHSHPLSTFEGHRLVDGLLDVRPGVHAGLLKRARTLNRGEVKLDELLGPDS